MTTRVIFSTTDLLNCLICYRQFNRDDRKPKVLMCGHTVCEDCTVHLRDVRPFPDHMRCPTCRLYVTKTPNQRFVTNFQILACLEEKERLDKEAAEKSEKPGRDIEEKLQLSIPRSKGMKIHVATKKTLNGPEMFIRKGADGETSMVIAGQTGYPDEITKYINENRIAIETGILTTRSISDHGAVDPNPKFVKVTDIVQGQSSLKVCRPPTKIEDAEFSDSYELKATEMGGKIQLELVRISAPTDGREVFGGTMTKPSEKKRPQPQPQQEPSTSDGPVAKRTRRGRGK
uniref:RING-type domain-containing protein n=1 Tax=Caenorhabditis japonica TaxID=281687 RepID=A0A8R1HS07_CAEJA